MLKIATLIVITTYSSMTGKPPEVVVEGSFYGQTHMDAFMACKVIGEKQLPITGFEYKNGVRTRGFVCRENRGN